MQRRVFGLLIIFWLLNFIIVEDVLASSFNLKIPFSKGEKWKITQGYEGDGWVGNNPTHAISNKDRYAIDFSLPGEEDLGKIVLATENGVAYVKSQIKNGKLEGYGQYIDIDHGNGLVSRYAHLLSYSVENGQQVKQGQEIGRVDNTGYKGGSHLHFAIYQKDINGSLIPYKPEPMSGYTNFTAGQWYISDNEIYDPNQQPNTSQTSSQVQPDVSLWSKITSFISDIFSSDGSEVKSEDTQVIAGDGDDTNDFSLSSSTGEGEETYNLQFLNSGQTLTAKPGEVLNLEVKVKNTGTATWQKQNISANVVGGQAMNNVYYHPSWVTKLRPAVLNENVVAPGGIGTFIFSINTPSTSGDYNFQIQAVRVDNNFSYVQGGVWSVNLKVATESIKILPDPPLVKEGMTSEEESTPVNENQKNIIEKTVEVIKEAVEQTVEKTVEIFQQVFNYGGSSGSSNQSSDNNQEEPEEQPEETTEIINEISTSTLEIDTTPPEIPIVEVYQSAFATPTLFVNWNSADAVSYDLQYKINGNEWMDFVTSTISTSSEMVVERWQNYLFRARGYDEAGNISEWSGEQKFLPDWPRTVVINEIAWMGVSKVATPMLNCSNHEWLELYNNSEETIDLTGWKLKINDKEILLSGSITAKDYYVMARKSGTKISLLTPTPDLVWQDKELPNIGGRLLLLDVENNVVDEVNSPGVWFAGENIDKFRSMSRIDTGSSGSLGENWETFNYLRFGPQSNSCGTVYGTPGQKNRGQWFLSSLLDNYSESWDENNVLNLSVENSPYLFDVILEIPAGYTLRAEAGTIFYGRNKNSYFKVLGNLEFLGTEEKPIVITSALDKNYLENVPSELSGEAGAGDWSRMEVYPGGKLQAENTKFFYGGRTFFFQTGVFVGGVGRSMSNIIFNLGGEVILDKTEFNYNYFNSNQPLYNSIVWSEAPNDFDATTTIANSNLQGGWTAIKNYRQNNGRVINFSLSNSIVENFQNPQGPIISERDCPNLLNNNFINNVGENLTFPTCPVAPTEDLEVGEEQTVEETETPTSTPT